MKLNKFFIAFAIICAWFPGMTYPMTLLKAIIRIETFQKPGFSDVILLHDNHAIKLPEQEDKIMQMLNKEKGHVSVEDQTEHIGSKYIQDSVKRPVRAEPGSINGLVGRLRKADISASNIDCRLGFSRISSASNKEIIDDFRNTVNKLTVANPTSPVDILSNAIIKHSQKRTEVLLADLERNALDSALDSKVFTTCATRDNVGFEIVDMVGLRAVCKRKGENNYNYQALIAGAQHCEDVGLCLQKLGYKRVKCLEGKGTKSRFIFGTFQQLLVPLAPTSSYFSEFNASEISLFKEYPLKPVSNKQIVDYFQKPDSYKVQEQSRFNSFDWLKNKVSSIMGRA